MPTMKFNTLEEALKYSKVASDFGGCDGPYLFGEKWILHVQNGEGMTYFNPFDAHVEDLIKPQEDTK